MSDKRDCICRVPRDGEPPPYLLKHVMSRDQTKWEFETEIDAIVDLGSRL